MSYFYDRFGSMPQVEASAPGRITLLGDHTDYNGGFVLPMALPHVTTVELLPSGDDQVVVTSLQGAHHADTCRYRLGEETPRHDWSDYIRGVTQILSQQGCPITGFQALIRSTVPMASGLSSSTALVVSLLRALRQAFGLNLDTVTIARLGQRIEHHVLGTPVGILDQMAASMGRADAALCLDTQDLSWRHLVLPDSVEVVVLHSGVVPRDAATHLDVRRQECQQAAMALEVSQLRELGVDDLTRLALLPDLLARRARHVITENARVLAAVEALDQGDMATVGRLLQESHRSLRDDYEIAVPDVDLLVDLLRFEPSVYGARMTGRGFGGAVVALVEANRGTVVAKKITRRYAEQSGRQPAIVLPA